jgi:hypothetical protein
VCGPWILQPWCSGFRMTGCFRKRSCDANRTHAGAGQRTLKRCGKISVSADAGTTEASDGVSLSASALRQFQFFAGLTNEGLEQIAALGKSTSRARRLDCPARRPLRRRLLRPLANCAFV